MVKVGRKASKRGFMGELGWVSGPHSGRGCSYGDGFINPTGSSSDEQFSGTAIPQYS